MSPAAAKSSTSSPKKFVLFHFVNDEYGLAYICAIKSPNVPKNESLKRVESFIQDKTPLVIRWPITQINQDSVIWNMTEYAGNRNTTDCLFRAGVAIAVSDDRDLLNKKREDLLLKKTKEQPSKQQQPVARQLNYPSTMPAPLQVSQGPASHEEGDSSKSGEAPTQKTQGKNKRLAGLDADQDRVKCLEAKVAKLEAELDFAKKALEDTTEEKEELLEERDALTKELETLRNLDPVHLAGMLQSHVAELRTLMDSARRSPSSSRAPSSGFPTPSSTPLPTMEGSLLSDAGRFVPVGDEGVMMRFHVLRDAVALGREGNSKEHLNAMVGKMIEGFIPSADERAKYSLTGRECRSIPQELRVKKKPFPKEFADAIAIYVTKRWDKWYKRTLTRTEINAAITAKFTNSHTAATRNKKKSQPAGLADGHTDADPGKTSDEILEQEVLDGGTGGMEDDDFDHVGLSTSRDDEDEDGGDD